MKTIKKIKKQWSRANLIGAFLSKYMRPLVYTSISQNQIRHYIGHKSGDDFSFFVSEKFGLWTLLGKKKK